MFSYPYPKKSLGQNFLTAPATAEFMVKAAEVKAEDTVLEVGPGKGILTESLLEAGVKVIAVEKDHELYLFLKKRFGREIEEQRLILIEGDILNHISSREFTFLKDGRRGKSYEGLNSRSVYKLVANIPYYLTSHLITSFLKLPNPPKLMVLMVQREVAERIIAKDGKENILSVFVKIYGAPKILKHVSAGSFFPKPKVDSAIISLKNIKKPIGVDEERLFELIKVGFCQKRKLLINNLKTRGEKAGIDWKKAFEKCGVDEKSRAENLTVEEWKRLSRFYPQ